MNRSLVPFRTGLGRTLSLLGVVALLGPVHARADDKAPATSPASNSAIEAKPRNDWMLHHERLVEAARKGGYNLVFVGDSITQGWGGSGRDVWARQYGRFKPLNLGISGDRTENVLWRLRHGEFDGLKPKAVVVMIGTNNVRSNTGPQIAEGVTAIVKEIEQRSPSSRILLLGVFPRGHEPGTPERKKLAEVNEIISKLDDGKTVFYLDIGEKFLSPDGTISKEIMPDFLHPNAAGYQIWASAMAPKLAQLLK